MSTCTNCGRELQVGAVACGVCGAAVPGAALHGAALPPPHAAAPPPPTPAYAVAPPPAAGYAPLPPAAAPSGKPKWLVPVVVLLVLAIGGGVAFMLGKGDDKKSTLGDTKNSFTDDTVTSDTTDTNGTIPLLTTKPTTGGNVDPGTGYTPEMRNVFVSSCTQPNASAAVCGCVYDAIAATIPFDEFITMSQAADGGASLLSDPRLVSAITTCMGG